MHMYAEHFHLKTLPFENVPDPQFFYNQGDHARIRKQISGSLISGRGLVVVTGPIGSGKTTLSQMIKADFPENIHLIWMAEPPANSIDLYLFLAQELGLQPSSSEKTFVMRDIRNALLQINAEGKKCLIIIDESHLMSEDVINGIRLLNNLEEGSTKLIQLLLLGQEELMEQINRPAMEPFKQRIAALETLGKMSVETVQKYISHRLQIAGGTTELVSDTGWEALSIAFHSGGTPRTINSLCDRSFSVAFERNKPSVDAHDVYEATQRLGLRTDVFHYIISLKSKERKSVDAENPVFVEQAVPETPQTSPYTSTTQPTYAEPAQAQQSQAAIRQLKPVNRSDSYEMQYQNKPQMDINESPYDDFAKKIQEKYQQKNLNGPIIILITSIITFFGSTAFFCHKSDAAGIIDCLVKLMSF